MKYFQFVFSRAVTIPIIALVLMTPGCSSKSQPTGIVSGEVTFQKKPLTNATIIFMAKDGSCQSSCELDAQGNFKLPGKIMKGDYRIAFSPNLRYDMEPNEVLALQNSFPVPVQWTVPEESPLEFTVESGENTASFKIP